MEGKSAIIALLLRAVSAESQARSQYTSDAEWMERVGLGGLAGFFRARASEEAEHFQKFSERLEQFFTHAVASPPSTLAFGSITELLRHQLALETQAVTLYTEACLQCLADADYTSFGVFQEILADENEHAAYLEGQLYLIAQMGEGNYLQGYIQLPEVK